MASDPTHQPQSTDEGQELAYTPGQPTTSEDAPKQVPEADTPENAWEGDDNDE